MENHQSEKSTVLDRKKKKNPKKTEPFYIIATNFNETLMV